MTTSPYADDEPNRCRHVVNKHLVINYEKVDNDPLPGWEVEIINIEWDGNDIGHIIDALEMAGANVYERIQEELI